jgi:hypothetical protein
MLTIRAREICEALARDQGLLDRLADKVAEELITAEFASASRPRSRTGWRRRA